MPNDDLFFISTKTLFPSARNCQTLFIPQFEHDTISATSTVKPVKLDTLKRRTPLEVGRLCRERSDSHRCVQTLKSWTLDYVGHLGLQPQGVQLNRFHCIITIVLLFLLQITPFPWFLYCQPQKGEKVRSFLYEWML